MRPWGLIARPLGLLVGVAALAACASATPPSRLADYMGQQALSMPASASSLPGQRPIRAGLVVISDTTAPDAAPPLPDEALNRLSELLRQEFSQFLPIAVEKIIPADGIQPGGTGAGRVAPARLVADGGQPFAGPQTRWLAKGPGALVQDRASLFSFLSVQYGLDPEWYV